MVASEQVF